MLTISLYSLVKKFFENTSFELEYHTEFHNYTRIIKPPETMAKTPKLIRQIPPATKSSRFKLSIAKNISQKKCDIPTRRKYQSETSDSDTGPRAERDSKRLRPIRNRKTAEVINPQIAHSTAFEPTAQRGRGR